MASYSLPTMSLTYDDHRRLFSVLPPSLHKIISAAPVRLYHAPLSNSGEQDWQYTTLKGIMVFGCDSRPRLNHNTPASYERGNFWFKLIDCRKGLVIWQHQVHEIVEYEADKPFFHVFSGKSRKFGFRFDEDEDAAVFFKEVQRRLVEIPLQKPSPKKSKPQAPRRSRKDAINSSMISSPVPDSFQHVAHMSVDEKGALQSSWNVGPEWTQLISKLEVYGVDAEMVEENIEFVKGFLAGAEAMRDTPSSRHTSPHSSPASTPPCTPPVTSDEEEDYFHVSAPKSQRYESIRRKPVPQYTCY